MSDLIEAEVVEAEKPTQKKKRGRLGMRYRLIAEYASRSYPVEVIADIVGLKKETIYHILSDNEEVWAEVNRILSDLFSEGDRMLVYLYKKALTKLDEQLESESPEMRDKAIEKVLKCYGVGKEGEQKKPPLVMQFFGRSSGGSPLGVESIDQIILRKRAERGLPSPEVNEEDGVVQEVNMDVQGDDGNNS
jgi:hypothetical protein